MNNFCGITHSEYFLWNAGGSPSKPEWWMSLATAVLRQSQRGKELGGVSKRPVTIYHDTELCAREAGGRDIITAPL